MTDVATISFPRWWVEQIRDGLFAMGNLPSGPLGDWAFLFREQLSDALAKEPVIPAQRPGTHSTISELDAASNACLELAAKHGFATGHGDTVADMIREFSGQISRPAQIQLDSATPDELAMSLRAADSTGFMTYATMARTLLQTYDIRRKDSPALAAGERDSRGGDICAACGAARREHTTPGGTRYGEQSLCGIFIPATGERK